jgi:hypothetical protein
MDEEGLSASAVLRGLREISEAPLEEEGIVAWYLRCLFVV